jgi:hypothetical protein
MIEFYYCICVMWNFKSHLIGNYRTKFEFLKNLVLKINLRAPWLKKKQRKWNTFYIILRAWFGTSYKGQKLEFFKRPHRIQKCLHFEAAPRESRALSLMGPYLPLTVSPTFSYLSLGLYYSLQRKTKKRTYIRKLD